MFSGIDKFRQTPHTSPKEIMPLHNAQFILQKCYISNCRFAQFIKIFNERCGNITIIQSLFSIA